MNEENIMYNDKALLGVVEGIPLFSSSWTSSWQIWSPRYFRYKYVFPWKGEHTIGKMFRELKDTPSFLRYSLL